VGNLTRAKAAQQKSARGYRLPSPTPSITSGLSYGEDRRFSQVSGQKLLSYPTEDYSAYSKQQIFGTPPVVPMVPAYGASSPTYGLKEAAANEYINTETRRAYKRGLHAAEERRKQDEVYELAQRKQHLEELKRELDRLNRDKVVPPSVRRYPYADKRSRDYSSSISGSSLSGYGGVYGDRRVSFDRAMR